MYVGESLVFTVRATDPQTRQVISDAIVTVDLFGPPKDPTSNPADRLIPDATLATQYDPTRLAYVGSISSAGFAPGKWFWRATLQRGSDATFDFARFILNP